MRSCITALKVAKLHQAQFNGNRKYYYPSMLECLM